MLIGGEADSFDPHNFLMLDDNFDYEMNFFINAISTIYDLLIWHFM